jgi:hypothetical protein
VQDLGNGFRVGAGIPEAKHLSGSRQHQRLDPQDAVQQDLCGLPADQTILFGSRDQREHIYAAERWPVVGFLQCADSISIRLVRRFLIEEFASPGCGPRLLTLTVELESQVESAHAQRQAALERRQNTRGQPGQQPNRG